MKATELFKFLEMTKAFKEPKAKRTMRKKDINLDDISITMMLQQKLEEAHMLEKLLKDHAKINKEEKKEEKSKWSVVHVSYFLLVTFPIIAPLYVAYLKYMLG